MLAQIAKQIFQETLLRLDAKDAIKRVVRVENNQLLIADDSFQLNESFSIYVVAIGKAAYQMAVGFDEIAGEFIKGGVVSGVFSENNLVAKWQVFAGGHPLPNEESFASAKVAFQLLEKADLENALVVFLISGGGSAMMELPRSEKISLGDLQKFNQLLVTSGATIAEINSIRRVVSKVKGGGLAIAAPNAKQISLIISDTADGDISSVASGPSLLPAEDVPNVFSVIEKYDLNAKFTDSINKVLENYQPQDPVKQFESKAHLLLDNKYALQQMAEIVEKLGFVVKVENESQEVFITDGCELLIEKFIEFKEENLTNRPICYISGGEFGCKVVGNGVGGRNSETVLRLSLLAQERLPFSEYAILSGGTDGIDGNSLAAGAVADETTLERAESQEMNPQEYLENSDSFSFFNNLSDAIIVGATGTNVRDIRIFLAK